MEESCLFDGTRIGDRVEDVRDDPHHPISTPVKEIRNNGGHAK